MGDKIHSIKFADKLRDSLVGPSLKAALETEMCGASRANTVANACGFAVTGAGLATLLMIGRKKARSVLENDQPIVAA